MHDEHGLLAKKKKLHACNSFILDEPLAGIEPATY